MARKKVLIIGGGVAGLSAALALEQLGIDVDLVEKSGFLGGHGIQYACKATDQCVKCGACVVEDTLEKVASRPGIRIFLNSQIQNLSQTNGRISIALRSQPNYIDPPKCSNCGQCYSQCPSQGAIRQGFSSNNHPLYALDIDNCLHFSDQACRICEDICPEKAIQLDSPAAQPTCEADAVIVAAGFNAFDPTDKPYGWGVFDNVITNLELERLLRRQGDAIRPSDGQKANRIGFIQCVGSRDAALNHLWCSRVCCGSALRMARMIKTRRPHSDISFFYLDVQNYGKDFEKVYADIQNDIRMIRGAPGDIFKTPDDCLRLFYFDCHEHKSCETVFDLIVLSVGMTPAKDLTELADIFALQSDLTGFLSLSQAQPGVFTAGAATGPMAIDDAIASANRAVWQTVQYLGI